jgi:DNA replication protein
MSLDIKEIDRLLADLLTRGLIEYTTANGKTITSLNPLKERLYREFQISVSKENEVRNNKTISDQLTNIYENFQQELGRSLSPTEVSTIREWVSMGYTDEVIINALKEAISQGKKSIKSVDKILLTWAKREELEAEGKTSINDDWTNNLEETIRIAKTPWLDEDDED